VQKGHIMKIGYLHVQLVGVVLTEYGVISKFFLLSTAFAA